MTAVWASSWASRWHDHRARVRAARRDRGDCRHRRVEEARRTPSTLSGLSLVSGWCRRCGDLTSKVTPT